MENTFPQFFCEPKTGLVLTQKNKVITAISNLAKEKNSNHKGTKIQRNYKLNTHMHIDWNNYGCK